MATRPIDSVTLSHEDLQRKHDEEGWSEVLKTCEQAGRMSVESKPGRGVTAHQTLIKYWDASNNTLAVIIRYRYNNGTLRSYIKMLRDGETLYMSPIGVQPPSSILLSK